MKRCKGTVVTKRDGSAECLNLAKLSSCVARALQACQYDARLAGPLVKAVALHLGEWHDSQPPTTDYVFRCACAVLQQTGLTDAAEYLEHNRRLREARRRRIRVIDAGELAQARRGRPWQKLALVATLQNVYGLRHAVARFLAGQVEAQVFALNYRTVTQQFLRELVRNEVLAWGLVDEQSLKALAAACEKPTLPERPEKENRI